MKTTIKSTLAILFSAAQLAWAGDPLDTWTTNSTGVGVLGLLTFGNGRFVALLGGGTVVQSGVIGKLGASLSPGGGVQGTLTGVTGQNYAIKASTDLVAWDTVTNITINTNGLAQFSDPATAAYRQRFYEALLSQQ